MCVCFDPWRHRFATSETLKTFAVGWPRRVNHSKVLTLSRAKSKRDCLIGFARRRRRNQFFFVAFFFSSSGLRRGRLMMADDGFTICVGTLSRQKKPLSEPSIPPTDNISLGVASRFDGVRYCCIFLFFWQLLSLSLHFASLFFPKNPPGSRHSSSFTKILEKKGKFCWSKKLKKTESS